MTEEVQKKINPYSNGKIYMIVSYSTGLRYYGSTVQPLNKRFNSHKALSNRLSSKTVIESGDAVILLVESFPCETKEQLNAKEGWYIMNNDCVNKLVAGRSDKQRYQDNKEAILEHKKQYRQDNKDAILERQKQYYQNNKEAIAKRMKQYYQQKKTNETL
jgi:hypothetical protein